MLLNILQDSSFSNQITFILHIQSVFSLPGRGFHQRVTLISSVPVTLDDVIVHVKIIATAPVDCQPRNWKRYVDDVICLVHTGKAKKLQQHMNTVDPTGSIIITPEDEENNSMPFLDTKFTRKEDGSVKSTVYRKKTHTDQYLNFASHHPKHQKLGVVRTLMHRCESITSEEGDKKEEVEHLRGALRVCGYPSWALNKKKKNKIKTNDRNYRSQGGLGESTPSTEEIWRSNNYASPHHPQALVGTSQGQSRARRTG